MGKSFGVARVLSLTMDRKFFSTLTKKNTIIILPIERLKGFLNLIFLLSFLVLFS
jgi:hypothetical protein